MTETFTLPAMSDAGSLDPFLGERPVWNDEVDQLLVCTQVVPVTHDVKTFVLEPLTPRVFRYDPGQFLTLTFTIGGQDVDRCYTISSPPTRPDLLTITVKRVPGGSVSNWLHDGLRVGDSLRANGPLGQFSMVQHPAAKYLFLSAGSGVTPLMSMTRTLYDLGEATDVVFVHCARSPADIIFRSELDAIEATAGDIRVEILCEADSVDEQWSGLRGRLSLPVLSQIVPDLHEREIFTCGPAPYMGAVRDILDLAGIDQARYHEESFDLAAAAAPPVGTSVPSGAQTYQVVFSRSDRTIECDADTNILDAAIRAGVNLPSSCGEGVCGTCKSTLIHGTVDMQHAGGIRPREIAQDKILICCSKPLDNLTIDA